MPLAGGQIAGSGRMFPVAPVRLKGFTYAGIHRYFLTFCTAHRRRVFVEPTSVQLVLSQIRQAADLENFALLAYCFMPDHLHLLVEGAHESADLRRFAKSAKQRSGFAYRRATQQQLWQPRYYDHVLRDEESAATVSRYVLENPIRSGLAQNIQDYPYNGSDVFQLGELVTGLYGLSEWLR